MFSIHPYFLFLWFFSFLLLTLSLHKNTIQGEQKWCYLYSWETSKKGKKSFSTRKWHWQTRLLTKNTTTSTFVIFTQKLVSLPKRTAAVKFLVFLRPTQIPLNLSFSLLLRPWKMVKSRIKPCLSSNQHKRRQRKRQKKEVFFCRTIACKQLELCEEKVCHFAKRRYYKSPRTNVNAGMLNFSSVRQLCNFFWGNMFLDEKSLNRHLHDSKKCNLLILE